MGDGHCFVEEAVTTKTVTDHCDVSGSQPKGKPRILQKQCLEPKSEEKGIDWLVG